MARAKLGRFERMRAGTAVIAAGAMLAACSSLLGIEDLSEEPRDGSDGTSGAGGSGGKSGPVGGSSGSAGKGGAQGGSNASGAGGGSGAAGNGTSGSGGSGAGSSGDGGSSGDDGEAGAGATGGSGGSNGGTSGSAGSGGGSTEGPVTGKIIDFWHNPLASVPVQIGDEQTLTDQNGEFSFENVAAEYDVSFTVRWDNPQSVYGWVYAGLTRRDPTLQVLQGVNEREVPILVQQENGTFTANSLWFIAFGSERGSRHYDSASNGVEVRPTWMGGAMHEWFLHSIFFEQTAGLPTAYTAYETLSIDVTDDTTAPDILFDLSPQTLDSDSVSGTVTSNTGTDRTNSVFVRFADGSSLPVVEQVDVSGAPFSYLVPNVPNSTITVAAAESGLDDAYAVVHRDGLAIDATAVDLVIPPSVSQLTPAAGATDVTNTSSFSFTGGDPDAHGYLVRIIDRGYRQGIYVVTGRTEFTLAELPILGGTFTLMAAEPHNWDVQTHGKPASVDDMAGPNGFIDGFGFHETRPAGLARESGSYTSSAYYYFETAPAPALDTAGGTPSGEQYMSKFRGLGAGTRP
jgi:hypothetical protein